MGKRKVGKYEFGGVIGEGSFGKVRFAVNTETEEQVAVKCLKKKNIREEGLLEQVKKEISVMKMIRHPNVVRMHEALSTKDEIFIVLEYVKGKELFDIIVQDGKLSEEQARPKFRQLVSAVAYCHSQGICHRDLKPENLLLDEDGSIKISDFGLSALVSPNTTSNLAEDLEEPEEKMSETALRTTCGTPQYVAPEVLVSIEGYDGKLADSWSCGVILYVLLAGFLPFDDDSYAQLFRKITKCEFQFPKWFSSGVIDLIEKMLIVDPKKRWSLSRVKKHPWLMEMRMGDVNSLPAVIVDQSQVEHAIETVESDFFDGKTESSNGIAGPLSLNAFDIITMVSGAALNQMIEHRDNATDQDVDPVHQKRSFTHFPSTKSIVTILDRIEEELQRMVIVYDVNRESCRVKASIVTPRGTVFVNIQVSVISDQLHMIEMRRFRGNIFAYRDFYVHFRASLSDLDDANAA